MFAFLASIANCIPSRNANSYYIYIHGRTQQAKHKIMWWDKKYTNKKSWNDIQDLKAE